MLDDKKPGENPNHSAPETGQALPDKTVQDVSEPELDNLLEDTFPASDPLPVTGSIAPTSDEQKPSEPSDRE